MFTIPCAIIRGGTSKGVFVLEEHLPLSPPQRERVLLTLMGSPDPRQINGLGGADPLTSKVAIVSRSHRPGVDVEYESVEVGIAESTVSHGVMCGNLLAGVGHFAIAEGLIRQQSPHTTLRIYCRSNRKIIIAKIPNAAVANRTAVVSAPWSPPWQIGLSAVSLTFPDPGGATTGRLLPANEPVSTLAINYHNGHEELNQLKVSIVDAGTLYAFIRADAFGLTGLEDVATLNAKRDFCSLIELVRVLVAAHVNGRTSSTLPRLNSRLIKLAIVGPPATLRGSADIAARVINPAGAHKAFAVSGGICLAAAAAISGTLVNDIIAPTGSPFVLRIAHPSGELSLLTHWSVGDNGTVIHSTEVERTARMIMWGTADVSAALELPDSRAGRVTRPVAARKVATRVAEHEEAVAL